jgi:hypothetical protein
MCCWLLSTCALKGGFCFRDGNGILLGIAKAVDGLALHCIALHRMGENDAGVRTLMLQ